VTDIAQQARDRGRVAQPEPLRRLTLFDWLFVGMAWLTCAYFVYIIMEENNPHPIVRFDFMPVLAGIMVVPVGWQAVRLRRQVDAALAGLDGGAALVVVDEDSMREFLADMHVTVGHWSVGVGLFVAAVMLAINFYLVVPDLGNLNAANTVSDAIRTIVMTVVGWLIGLLLGRLAGFAKLFRVMDRHEIKLAGLSTPAARIAMRSLEQVFRFATMATNVLCHWFACWWVLWSLGIDPHQQYSELWARPFLILWGVSFALYLWTARAPALAFQRRLDTLYGSSAERGAVDISLVEAEAELGLLKNLTNTPNRRWRAELSELERYIAHLKELRFRSRLLNPRILNALIAWNLLLIVIPVLRHGL
jgi:hypothetical protein